MSRFQHEYDEWANETPSHEGPPEPTPVSASNGQKCGICGEPKPQVPGPPSPPPYFCLKHREHVEGKRCLDPQCPVCVL